MQEKIEEQKGIIGSGQDQSSGGHAVILVGENLDEDYYLLKNSWGHGWADNGHFRISRKALKFTFYDV